MTVTELKNAGTVGYSLHGNRYLNITNRCTLRCGFCPKFNGSWTVQGHDLRLRREPSVDEIVAAAGNPGASNEIVFCGLGEPTLRLYDMLDAARQIKARGYTIRLNTDGLANLVYDRDITPDLEGLIDAVSISLNAQNEDVYTLHCMPKLPGAYAAMLDFARRVGEFVPVVTLTALDGLDRVDIEACVRIAADLQVGFRRRVLDQVG